MSRVLPNCQSPRGTLGNRDSGLAYPFDSLANSDGLGTPCEPLGTSDAPVNPWGAPETQVLAPGRNPGCVSGCAFHPATGKTLARKAWFFGNTKPPSVDVLRPINPYAVLADARSVHPRGPTGPLAIEAWATWAPPQSSPRLPPTGRPGATRPLECPKAALLTQIPNPSTGPQHAGPGNICPDPRK